jgi:hypothetical protein
MVNGSALIHNKLPSPGRNMIISKCSLLLPSALTIWQHNGNEQLQADAEMLRMKKNDVF